MFQFYKKKSSWFTFLWEASVIMQEMIQSKTALSHHREIQKKKYSFSFVSGKTNSETKPSFFLTSLPLLPDLKLTTLNNTGIITGP